METALVPQEVAAGLGKVVRTLDVLKACPVMGQIGSESEHGKFTYCPRVEFSFQTYCKM